MMPRHVAPLLPLCLAGALLQTAGSAQTPTPQTVFRTNTDLVTIPVFVKGSDGTSGNFAASDFVLTDNGVRQAVETIDSESLPVDVTVMMETGHAIEPYRKSLNEQVRRIAAMMRPTDRIEVLGIDSYVSVLVPFGAPTRDLHVETFTGGGMLSVNDALVAALLRESDPDRRHLIIAMTDSIDTMSTLTMANVRDVARQSRSTLVVSWITLSQDEPPARPRGEPLAGEPMWMTAAERLERHVRAPRTRGASASLTVGRSVPRRQQWTPHYDPPKGRVWGAFEALREAADLTGGAVHPPGVFTDRNAAAIFDKIYAEFRKNYILRYLPQGVTRDGWHDVKVTIPGHDGLEVRARRGYLVEPVVVPPPPPTPTPAVRVLTAFTDAAARDDLAGMRDAVAEADTPERLMTLVKDFEATGGMWTPQPHRECVAALVLADAAVRSTSDDLTSEAVTMLARYGGLVRPPLGPDAFERDWLTASTFLLGAVVKPAEAWPAASAASNRFPDDGRPLLARAIVGDQFIAGLPNAPGGRNVAPESVDQVLTLYDAALKHSDVADEARIRKGWLLKRLGRTDEATVAFDLAAAGVANDPRLQRFLNLVRAEPAVPPPSMDGESWRLYWQGDRGVFEAALGRLIRQGQQ